MDHRGTTSTTAANGGHTNKGWTTLSCNSSSTNSKDGKRQSRPRSGFTALDVLSGRGGLANTHTGNRVYRRLVDLNKECYSKLASKREKGLLVDSIIMAVQKHGGRFLKQNSITGEWDEELTYKQTVLKTGQALREQDKHKPQPAPSTSAATATKATTTTTTCTKRTLKAAPTRKATLSSSSTTTAARPTQPEQQTNNPTYCQSKPTSVMPLQKKSKTPLIMDAISDDDSCLDSLVVPPPPMLRLWSSALHPATSKIAGPIHDQWADTTTTTHNDESCPPPVISFDEVIQRQESLGISNALIMPDLTFESSGAFATSTLIDD